MAIFGVRYTALQTYGVPGRVGGPYPPSWFIPLDFILQVAGKPQVSFEYSETLQVCQRSDVGIELGITIVDNNLPINISEALSIFIKVLYPDGSSVDYNGSLYSDGLDGKVIYDTQLGDLNQIGLYQLQAKVLMGNAPKSTRLGAFIVKSNVDET